jgi:hypothetical protein
VSGEASTETDEAVPAERPEEPVCYYGNRSKHEELHFYQEKKKLAQGTLQNNMEWFVVFFF